MSDIDLKGCPFCGSKAEVDDSDLPDSFSIYCSNSKCSANDAHINITDWNTRPTTTAIAAREAAIELYELGWLDIHPAPDNLDDALSEVIRILSKHCSPVSGDVISRQEAIRIAEDKLEALREQLTWEEPSRSVLTEMMGILFGIATDLRALPTVRPVAAGGEADKENDASNP